MANISLKRLFEAEDFKAKSKETGKLVHFKSKDSYQAALKAGTHEDPKAKKGGASKRTAKPNDMFGGDYVKDRGGESPKPDSMATVNSIAAKTGMRAQAVAGWADENGVNLSKVSADIDSKKLNPKDLMTAVVGNPGNKYAKDIIAKYSQSDSTPTKSKYDDKSYWKDADYEKQGQGADDDWDDDDSWGEGPQLTSDRLGKVESALEDELDLRGNGFETTRESGGGGGGWEGPMTIVSKDADYDSDDYISLSVGSPNNDGKFSIVFANANGEPHFEPNYDALTGDTDLEPQQAYKVTKALMKMPEVQKVLKGEMKLDEFKPIYDKLKSKFSKTESTKLASMIKR
jgi:hypothetical protein